MNGDTPIKDHPANDTRTVTVTIGGQSVSVSLPIIYVDRSQAKRSGHGLLYSELYHFWFKSGKFPLSRKVGAPAIAVLDCLLVDANWATMLVCPDKSQIAYRLDLSVRSVYTALERLQKNNVIAKLPSLGNEGGRGKKSWYMINLPIVLNSANIAEFNDAETVQKTTLNSANIAINPANIAEFPSIRSTTDITTDTTTEEESSRGVPQDQDQKHKEVEKLVELFLQGPKAGHGDLEKYRSIFMEYLATWDFFDIRTAIEKCASWAEHPNGVKSYLESKFISTRQQKIEQQDKNEQRHRDWLAQIEKDRRDAADPMAVKRLHDTFREKYGDAFVPKSKQSEDLVLERMKIAGEKLGDMSLWQKVSIEEASKDRNL